MSTVSQPPVTLKPMPRRAWHRITLRAGNGQVMDLAEVCPQCWPTCRLRSEKTPAAWIDVIAFLPTAGVWCTECGTEAS